MGLSRLKSLKPKKNELDIFWEGSPTYISKLPKKRTYTISILKKKPVQNPTIISQKSINNFHFYRCEYSNVTFKTFGESFLPLENSFRFFQIILSNYINLKLQKLSVRSDAIYTNPQF